jgi:DNA-binding CsgD family transcriptional regulator
MVVPATTNVASPRNSQWVCAQKTLTMRQTIALELVSRGCCTKEIAIKMGISEAGAKKHLDTLRRLYAVANRAQLVRRAYECGDLPCVMSLLEVPEVSEAH